MRYFCYKSKINVKFSGYNMYFLLLWVTEIYFKMVLYLKITVFYVRIDRFSRNPENVLFKCGFDSLEIVLRKFHVCPRDGTSVRNRNILRSCHNLTLLKYVNYCLTFKKTFNLVLGLENLALGRLIIYLKLILLFACCIIMWLRNGVY